MRNFSFPDGFQHTGSSECSPIHRFIKQNQSKNLQRYRRRILIEVLIIMMGIITYINLVYRIIIL